MTMGYFWVKLFLLQIITRFDSSTYHDFKLSLQDQNRHILQHLEECENFKGWYKLLTCDDSMSYLNTALSPELFQVILTD